MLPLCQCTIEKEKEKEMDMEKKQEPRNIFSSITSIRGMKTHTGRTVVQGQKKEGQTRGAAPVHVLGQVEISFPEGTPPSPALLWELCQKVVAAEGLNTTLFAAKVLVGDNEDNSAA